MREQWWPWALRATWLSLPFAAGPLFGDALADSSRPVQVTATVGLWVLWALGLVATAFAHHVTLTPLRVLAPGAVALSLWASFAAEVSWRTPVALGATAVTATVAFAPAVGAWFVDGSSYGDERRLPLRPPAVFLLGPIELAWLCIAATVVAGPLLVAAKQWIAGFIVIIVGGALSCVAFRSLAALARRWLVFVPAGMVLHDHMTVAAPVLVKRNAIEALGPALADTGATDLTMGALGLALEAQFVSPVTIDLRTGHSNPAKPMELVSFAFSVSRPGVALDEAERRKIAVG